VVVLVDVTAEPVETAEPVDAGDDAA